MEKKYLEKQQLFDDGLFTTTKIDTKMQLADILTKPLSVDKFKIFNEKLTSRIEP